MYEFVFYTNIILHKIIILFIFQLINKLLESKSKIQCDKSKYKSEKNVVLQETDGTTISSGVNKKVKIINIVNILNFFFGF